MELKLETKFMWELFMSARYPDDIIQITEEQ